MGRNSIDEYQWREGPFSPCHLCATLYNIEAEYTDFVFIISQFGMYPTAQATQRRIFEIMRVGQA